MRHFFISYNKADQVWAEWIAWVLEEAGYSTIIQAWDFCPGRNFVIEMNKAAMETEQTIAIISQDYLDAEFTYPEWAAAFARDPKGENRTLIPVRVRECTTPGPLKALIYLDLMGLSEESAHEAILTALEGRGKPATSPAFPGGAVTHQAAYPPSIKVLSNIPHSRNPFFTGRKNILKRLHKALHSHGATVLSQPQAISGLGSVGKTQTAIEYAYQYRDEYTRPSADAGRQRGVAHFRLRCHSLSAQPGSAEGDVGEMLTFDKL